MSSWHRSRRQRPFLSRSHQTRQRRKYFCLTKKEILTILSSLALPLVLGIFTVIITFDQKDLANKARLEDRRLADEERTQDLNISREQRREDRELAREQRLQDLNQAILQRELERTIANETRIISDQTRIHQLEIEEKRYRDVLFTNYINQISNLLNENNETITNISLTTALIRVKTLTLLRQLDSKRNSEVIRFLYEANQLNTSHKFPLDLSYAELFGIDMSSRKIGQKMHNLHLPGVDLTGSSFVNQDLTGTNFSGATLIDVDFSFTTLNDTDLSYTIFNGSFNFYATYLKKINLAFAKLTGVDFNKILPTHLEARQVDKC